MKNKISTIEYSTELLNESKNVILSLYNLFKNTDGKSSRELANNFFIEQSGQLETIKSIKNFNIINKNDNYQIPIKLYQINDIQTILLFAHGGGWIQGNLDTHDYLCRKIAKILNINVLAVNYRLAPENHFPIPLEDICSVYNWCCNKFNKIYISGDSAGGNLCSALCIEASKKQLRKPDAMILFYPVLGNDFNTESYKLFKNIITLSRTVAIYFLSQYSGEEYNFEKFINNNLIAPNLEENMSIFPRTFIVSAGCDVLLTEQYDFVKKMHKANNDCQQLVLDGAIHGFMTYGKEFECYNTDILKQVAKWIEKP